MNENNFLSRLEKGELLCENEIKQICAKVREIFIEESNV